MKQAKESCQEKVKNAAEWLEGIRLLFRPECCYDTKRYLNHIKNPR